MKIKIRLTLIFLLISLVPLAIMTGFSLDAARRVLKDTIGKSIENLAREKADAVALVIKERVNEAKILSEVHEVTDTVKEANLFYTGKTDKEIRDAIKQTDKKWIASKGSTEAAREILNSDLSMFLMKYQNKTRDKYGEIFVTDIKGTTVASTKILSDYYQADEGWWKSSFDGGKGKIFIDDRGFDESIGVIVMGIVVPLRSNGEVIGILKINYRIHSIIEIVLATHSREAGFGAKLVNSNEDVIVYSGEGGFEKISEVGKILLQKNRPGWIEDTHSGRKTIMGYSPINVEIHTRVPNPGEIKGISGEKWVPARWHMLIDIEQDKVFAPINRLINVILVIGILIAAVVVTLALYYSRTISRPIQKLIKGTEIIGSGDLSYKLGIETKDEIGDLSRAFNQMSEDLKGSTTSINNLSKEITERKRIEKLLHHKAELMQLLQEITITANEASSIENAMNICLKNICLFTGWPIGHVYEIDPKGERLIPTKIWHLESPSQRFKMFRDITETTSFDKGVGMLGKILKNGKPLYIADVTKEPWFLRAKSAKNVGIKSGFGFPVLESEKVVAVLEFYSEKTAEPDKSLLEALSYLAVQLGRVTERKRAEEYRKILVDDLKKTNTELKDFAYIVSHDLKAPLRGIISLAEWTKKDYAEVLDDEGRENLDLLVGRSHRMNRLIEGILRYSRIGQIKPELVWVDSKKIADNVIEPLVFPDNISILVEEALPEILYDNTHLVQLFQNLIDNAIIHMEKREGKIIVSCSNKGSFWEFCVRDNGVGIEEKHFERIFKIFQSLKPRDEVEATGIGLALCKKIVESHGGSIWVESKVGEGSAFFFSILKKEKNKVDKRSQT